MRRLFRSLLFQVRSLFGSSRKQNELDEELQFHVDTRIEHLMANGLSEVQARREATLELGGMDQAKEHCRDAWGTRMISDLFRDLRYSARGLWKDMSFSLVVVITLALCIGANTTVLSALHGLILKPLPVENPETLVQLFNSTDHRQPSNTYSQSSWNQYEDLKVRTNLFDSAALRVPSSRLITREGASQRIPSQTVSVEFFDMMNARPVLGRFFRADEHAPTPAQVMVLSETTWETDYNSDPDVLGQHVSVDKDLTYTIIGVAPRSMETFDPQARFTLPGSAPANRNHNFRYSRGSQDLWLRLKTGVSREVALEQIKRGEREWYQTITDEEMLNRYAAYQNYHFDWPHPLRGTLYLLEGGSLLILLVGCFNVMTLVLSRVNRRRHELSVRAALGAEQSSLRQLMLTEAVWLGLAAIGFGLLLTLGGTQLINDYLQAVSPRTHPIALNETILGGAALFAVSLVAITCLLPLEVLWRTGQLQRLDHSSRSASASGFSRRLSSLMVIGQVAIAFILLASAGLLLRSFQNIMAVDPGFPAHQIVEGRVDRDSNWLFYPKRKDANTLRNNIHAAMEEIPGVDSVSFSSAEMFAGDTRGGDYLHHWVTPGFFDTMEMKLIEGRDFNIGDRHDTTVILDERYARQMYPNGDALGAKLPVPWAPQNDWPTVIGIVGRASLQGQEQRDGTPYVYLSGAHLGWWGYSILIRTERPSAEVIQEMRSIISEIDPRLPLNYARPLNQALDEMLVGRKGITVLLLTFAGLAVFLSALGIYSLLAYDVQQRRREIGIRSAIGASQSSILKLILSQGSSKAALGLGVGVLGSFYLTSYLEAQLFDISSLDPLTYLFAIGGVMGVALLASFIPALRAVRINPVEALKSE